MDKIIFHIDVNSAFLSWEASYRVNVLGHEEDLRNIPSAVAGDVKMRSGIIIAKSVPAKKFGIKTGEAIFQAKNKCPNLVLVPPHYDLYDRCSKTFVNLLKEYAPVVEQYSIDEVFLDMTGTCELYGTPVATAEMVKDKIKNQLGFTVNIGISSNKLLAKMASDFPNADSVYTIFPNEIKEKLWPLPVGDLFFIGRASKQKLNNIGIFTIGQLASADEHILCAHMGKKYGKLIHYYANGIDVGEVCAEPDPNKAYGNSLTAPFDVDNLEDASQVLLGLSESVGRRLRHDNVQASCISVELKDIDFNCASHQRQMLTYTDVTNEIYEVAIQLYRELWDGRTPIRQIGVRASKVSNTGYRQYNCFDGCKYDRLRLLDQAIDKIRERYGDDSVLRSSFLQSPVYHLCGGILPEKRRITY